MKKMFSTIQNLTARNVSITTSDVKSIKCMRNRANFEEETSENRFSLLQQYQMTPHLPLFDE